MKRSEKDIDEIIGLLLSDYGQGLITGIVKTLEMIAKKAESKDPTSEDG